MTTDRSSGGAGEPPRPSAPSSRPPRSRTTAGSSSTSSAEGFVEAGRIGRPHGLDGSFHVTRPDPDLLGLPFRLQGRIADVQRRAGTADRPILRVAGIDSRDAVEALRGEPLFVAESDLPPLEEGEVWAHELPGCVVVDGPRVVGQVRRLLGLPSCEVLEVEREGGGELLLVPMVRDAVRSLDVPGRRIDVDLEFLGEA